MLLTKFWFIWPNGFREDFLEINHSETRIACGGPCLLTYQDEMSNLNRGYSIDTYYQVSVHLAKWFQRRRFFRNRPIRNKNCLWRPCLLTDGDKIIILYGGPFIDASYQVSIHLAKVVTEKIFRKRPIRNKNCLWQPGSTNQDDMRKFYRGPSIYASYQVSIHLAKQFQRRRIFLNWPNRNKNCRRQPTIKNELKVVNIFCPSMEVIHYS